MPSLIMQWFGGVACVIAVIASLPPALFLLYRICILPLYVMGASNKWSSLILGIVTCGLLLLWSAGLLRWGRRVWNRVQPNRGSTIIGVALFSVMAVASKYLRVAGIPPLAAQLTGLGGVTVLIALRFWEWRQGIASRTGADL